MERLIFEAFSGFVGIFLSWMNWLNIVLWYAKLWWHICANINLYCKVSNDKSELYFKHRNALDLKYGMKCYKNIYTWQHTHRAATIQPYKYLISYVFSLYFALVEDYQSSACLKHNTQQQYVPLTYQISSKFNSLWNHVLSLRIKEEFSPH